MCIRDRYATPGGTILMEAHDQLEELCLDRATMEVKTEPVSYTHLIQATTMLFPMPHFL